MKAANSIQFTSPIIYHSDWNETLKQAGSSDLSATPKHLAEARERRKHSSTLNISPQRLYTCFTLVSLTWELQPTAASFQTVSHPHLNLVETPHLKGPREKWPMNCHEGVVSIHGHVLILQSSIYDNHLLSLIFHPATGHKQRCLLNTPTCGSVSPES